MRFHPAADAFPLLEGPAFTDLVTDVRGHGLRNPITLHRDGSIVDGRNRWRACQEAGVQPRFETFEGPDSDVVAYVVSQNLHRRHLNESQRGMVAAKLATLGEGNPHREKVTGPIGPVVLPVSTAEAAKLLNVGERTVKRARVVQEKGVPELVQAVEQGKVTVNAAATVAKLPKQTQRAVANEPARIKALAARTRASKRTKKTGSEAAWADLLLWRMKSRNYAIFRPVFDAVDALRSHFDRRNE